MAESSRGGWFAGGVKRFAVCNHGFVLALLMMVVVSPLWCAEFARAQEGYTLEGGEWVAQAKADPNSAEGELQAIRTMLETNAKQAEKLAKAFIEKRPNHPMIAEAYLLRGDALVKRRRYYKALYDYEFVIRVYAGTEHYLTAIEREFEIARLFAAGMKRRLLGMRIVPAGEEAEELFIRIQERLPGSTVGEKASMALGDYYFDRSDMKMAAEAYDLFLINYPRSAMRERALLRLIEASLARFKGPQFDSTGLIEAAERLKDFQSEFPAAADRIGSEALLVRVNESMALKALLDARWYLARGRQVGAAYSLRRVVVDYPDTEAAELALVELSQLDPSIVDEVIQNPSPKEDTVKLELDTGEEATPLDPESGDLDDSTEPPAAIDDAPEGVSP